jgi:hypothetical protein
MNGSQSLLTLKVEDLSGLPCQRWILFPLQLQKLLEFGESFVRKAAQAHHLQKLIEIGQSYRITPSCAMKVLSQCYLCPTSKVLGSATSYWLEVDWWQRTSRVGAKQRNRQAYHR